MNNVLFASLLLVLALTSGECDEGSSNKTLTCNLQADCTIGEIRYQGYDAYVLENGLIRVRVLAGASGKILGLEFKPTGQELFQPLEEETIQLSNPPIVINTNFAGYKDMIWEHGFSPASRVYRGTLAENGPERASVRVEWIGGGYTLSRVVSVARGAACVTVETTITSTSKEEQTLSYWSQVPVLVADSFSPKGTQFVPVRNVPREASVRQRAYHNGVERVLAQTPPAGSTNYPPGQPWWALRSEPGGLTLGLCYPDMACFLPDGFFYTFCNSTLLTQETIFASRTFAPGQARTYTQQFVVILGLDRVDTLSANVAVAVNSSLPVREKAGGKFAIDLSLWSPTYMPDCTVELLLFDEKDTAAVVGKSGLVCLTPLASVSVRIDGCLPLFQRTGNFGVRLLRSGEEVATLHLLGARIEVTE